jgi:GTP-binding protein EngB required for normal cell division
MGYEYSMNVFICGNLTEVFKNVIYEIFQEKGSKSYSYFRADKDFDVYFSYNNPLENYKFYWIGHIFKNSSEDIIKSICEGIQKMNIQYHKEKSNKIDIRRNNVILYFLNEEQDSSIIKNKIEEMNNTDILPKNNNPIIVTVGGREPDIEYENLNFINSLPGGNKDDIKKNVLSKLLTIDAYLNERGNIFDQIVYNHLVDFRNLAASTCLDILIFGGSRAGKSTFINILSNQLLAREQENAEICTTKCTEYLIPLKNKNDNNNQVELNNEQLLNQIIENTNKFPGKLKIIDTPGLIHEKDIDSVNKCIDDYISKENEIIQLALFFMKDTTVLNKSKKTIQILLKYKIPVFFIETHSIYNKNIKIEDSKFFSDIKSFIVNNFNDNKRELLIYCKEEKEIYNIIKLNQKKDKEHDKLFGLEELIEKILHFFLYEKIDSVLNEKLNDQQNFYQQKNILSNNLSDLSSNYLNFSLHKIFFRKFSTLANVTEYYYLKSYGIISSTLFICCSSCLIPVPFIDLPIYYAAHFKMIQYILSVFGIKLNEVDMQTIFTTNGKNLGVNYNDLLSNRMRNWIILNKGIKYFLNLGKYASDAAHFIPIFGYFGTLSDIIFSAIDTSLLGRNLINTCNQLPKKEQFFKIELEKFLYVLNGIEEIRKRVIHNQN